MRLTRAAAALALALALGAGAARAAERSLDAEAAVRIDGWAHQRHADPALFDKPKLIARARAGARPGEPPEAFWARLAGAVDEAYFAFAPRDAAHGDGVRYRLPFELDVPRFLVQGVDGELTHRGAQRFAFDFAMPIGTPVLAARDGRVARVRDGFTEGGFDPAFSSRDNTVYVLHADGTVATYTHLRAGIPLREGQAVKAGDAIGRSGSTGYTAGPHLHFAVHRYVPADPRDPGSGGLVTVPIRFGVGSPQGFVPQQGQFYGGRPRRSIALRVRAGGQPIDEQHPLRLAPGAQAALAVELTSAEGETSDVTRSPETAFLAPTAWSVVVDAKGIVTASPSPDFAAALAKMTDAQKPPGSQSWGVVVVSHEDAPRGRYGFASVPVLIGDAAH